MVRLAGIYAERLSKEKNIDTLWMKVARKNKLGAKAIQRELGKSEKEKDRDAMARAAADAFKEGTVKEPGDEPKKEGT